MTIVEHAVAKSKGRPKQERRHDASTKIDATVLAQARMVAKARGITVAEYLTDLVRGSVARDFSREMKRLAEEGDG